MVFYLLGDYILRCFKVYSYELIIYLLICKFSLLRCLFYLYLRCMHDSPAISAFLSLTCIIRLALTFSVASMLFNLYVALTFPFFMSVSQTDSSRDGGPLVKFYHDQKLYLCVQFLIRGRHHLHCQLDMNIS